MHVAVCCSLQSACAENRRRDGVVMIWGGGRDWRSETIVQHLPDARTAVEVGLVALLGAESAPLGRLSALTGKGG